MSTVLQQRSEIESITCMENATAIFVFNSSRAKGTFPVLKRVGKVVLLNTITTIQQHGSFAAQLQFTQKKIQQTKPRRRLLQVLLDDSKMSTSAMRLLRKAESSSRMAQKRVK